MPNDSRFDRRDFLSKVTVLGFAGLVGGGSIDVGSQPQTEAIAASDVHLDLLSADDFAKYLGDTFRIKRTNGDRLEARLIQVQPTRPGETSRVGSRQPFSVTFRLHGTEPLAHETCLVEHAKMGRFPLFLGAVGAPAAEIRLEAIFG